MIRLVTFYNSTVTPQDDALIYENSLPASGMIYGGNVTIKNANTLHITAGHGALCGRKFTIEEDDIPIILTSSGTLNGRLYIHMDLSDTGEPISLEVERANSLTPVIQQSNVNITDGIYEINLATFTISTSTVSDLNYVAPFIKDLDLREVIIAPVEPSNIASSNYAVGKHLILDKVLYVVTTTITAGQTITPGSNVAVSDTVEKQIEDINTALGTKVNTADIANNLTTTAAGKVLDARQGKALNDVLVPKANQAVIATRQTNLTASRAYKVGDQFIYNNTLYRATAAISSGGTINIGSGGNATTADNITTQISKSWQIVVTTSNQYIAGGEIWYSKMGSVVVVHGAIVLSKTIPASAVIAPGFPKPYRNVAVPVFVMSINPYNHIASIDANGNLTNTNLVDWGGANEMWWNIFATYICQ